MGSTSRTWLASTRFRPLAPRLIGSSRTFTSSRFYTISGKSKLNQSHGLSRTQGQGKLTWQQEQFSITPVLHKLKVKLVRQVRKVARFKACKVVRSAGCKVKRSQGHKVKRSQNHKITKSKDPMVAKSQDHKDTRSQRHKITISQGHKITRSQGHKVTRSQGNKMVSRSQHREIPWSQDLKITRS